MCVYVCEHVRLCAVRGHRACGSCYILTLLETVMNEREEARRVSHVMVSVLAGASVLRPLYENTRDVPSWFGDCRPSSAMETDCVPRKSMMITWFWTCCASVTLLHFLLLPSSFLCVCSFSVCSRAHCLAQTYQSTDTFDASRNQCLPVPMWTQVCRGERNVRWTCPEPFARVLSLGASRPSVRRHPNSRRTRTGTSRWTTRRGGCGCRTRRI